MYSHLKIAQNKIKVKPWTWKAWGDGSVTIDRWDRCAQSTIDENSTTFNKELVRLKEHDIIKFLRADELIVRHTRTSEPEELYDLTMGNSAASNYLIYGGPFSKNSDGDLLAVFGLMSKEGLEDAKAMSPENPNRLKDPLDPDSVDNWIQKDSILGLYVGTK
jgi:hypothetical protein